MKRWALPSGFGVLGLVRMCLTELAGSAEGWREICSRSRCRS